MEEGREWKKKGEGGIRSGIQWFWRVIFWRVFWGEILEEKEKESDVTKEGRNLEEGINSRAKKTNYSRETRKLLLALSARGLGDRKPVGFLRLAGLTLVGRVDHPVGYQGSNQ